MLRRKGKHFSFTDRLRIEAMLKAGCTQTAVAAVLGCTPSAISREVKRGLCELVDALWRPYMQYCAEVAQRTVDWNATAKGAPLKLGFNHSYAEYVASRIHDGLSPDAIVGELRRENRWTVCTTTLYSYIERGYIPGVTVANLPEKPRRKPTKRKVKPARPPRGVSIESRPNISARDVLGHWEMDTVIGHSKGKRQAFLVMTERKTRQEIIRHIADKSSRAVCRALSKIVPSFPAGTFQSITVDNGTEFSDYSTMCKMGVEVYYCHPYSSYERGSNERQNRIIRRFFPKGTSLANVPASAVADAETFINNLPRRIFGYKTSQMLFDEWQAQLLKKL